MKYYYNNQLIRTSKNHIYSHAVIVMDKDGKAYAMGCRRSLAEAEAFKESEINGYLRGIENCHKAIKALQEGKEGYYSRDGRRDWYVKFSKDLTVEYYEEIIEDREKAIKNIQNNWKVVELEAR